MVLSRIIIGVKIFYHYCDNFLSQAWKNFFIGLKIHFCLSVCHLERMWKISFKFRCEILHCVQNDRNVCLFSYLLPSVFSVRFVELFAYPWIFHHVSADISLRIHGYFITHPRLREVFALSSRFITCMFSFFLIRRADFSFLSFFLYLRS